MSKEIDTNKVLTIMAIVVSALCVIIGVTIALSPKNDLNLKAGIFIVIMNILLIPMHIYNLFKK